MVLSNELFVNKRLRFVYWQCARCAVFRSGRSGRGFCTHCGYRGPLELFLRKWGVNRKVREPAATVHQGVGGRRQVILRERHSTIFQKEPDYWLPVMEAFGYVPRGKPDWVGFTGFLLRSVTERSEKWVTQVFINGHGRYLGRLDRDYVLCGWVDAMKQEIGGIKQYQLRLPAELHWWFKMYAARNHTTMRDVLVRHIRSLQAREETKVRVQKL